jgi:hypothetical protein
MPPCPFLTVPTACLLCARVRGVLLPLCRDDLLRVPRRVLLPSQLGVLHIVPRGLLLPILLVREQGVPRGPVPELGNAVGLQSVSQRLLLPLRCVDVLRLHRGLLLPGQLGK